jgi:hypothetical protein
MNILKAFIAAIGQHAEAHKIASRTFVNAVVGDYWQPGGSSECQSLPLTSRAFAAVRALDEGLVGTPDYLGLAYFWPHEYKHELRAATPKQRKAVHDAILAAGLILDDVTLKHAEIVRRYTAKRCKKVYG